MSEQPLPNDGSPANAAKRYQNEYIVDLILPAREVHLLGGPSGAGKTRWLMNTLLAWERGEDVLGFKAYPVPWVYVASDRTMPSVERTLSGMGIDPARITTIPAWDKMMSLFTIMDEVDKAGAKLAVIESFGSFVDPPGTGQCVKQYLQRMSRWARHNDVTLIGVVESPKLKPHERYENPRQRISGVAGWSHFSETVMLVEPQDFKNGDSPYRNLFVRPRNGPGKDISLVFDHLGRLMPSEIDDLSQLPSR